MGKDYLGRDVTAIYPMLENGTTWLLAADFDEANWKADRGSLICAFLRDTQREDGAEDLLGKFAGFSEESFYDSIRFGRTNRG